MLPRQRAVIDQFQSGWRQDGGCGDADRDDKAVLATASMFESVTVFVSD